VLVWPTKEEAAENAWRREMATVVVRWTREYSTGTGHITCREDGKFVFVLVPPGQKWEELTADEAESLAEAKSKLDTAVGAEPDESAWMSADAVPS
jgi:hypothetical protein